MKTDKLIYLFAICLLTFVITSPAMASDNATIMQEGNIVELGNEAVEIESSPADYTEIESSSNNELNPVGVDYYFNVSIDEDGDGSAENPYKTLTNGRLLTGSTIHLANGEYNLNNGKSLNKVTIIGQDAENTIIRYSGSSNCGKFSIGVDNYLVLQNLTLIGFNIDLEGSTLQATNTIFKNAVAFPTSSAATDLVNSASNSFGGAIYAYNYQTSYDTYNPIVILENCTFENNTAEYGGAIFINVGTLDITNSTFINNYAYNYGGAIANVFNSALRIKNSKFINDYSSNDAGGAIYQFKSSLSANNVSIINCSATFGGAIASLNSTTALVYFNGINNTAKYEGGAIYQIYSAISTTDSIFLNNSARNGGALYVDDVEIFKLQYNVFENNNALYTAGAVYSLLNRNMDIKNNTYISNKAYKNDDFYHSDSIISFIGNGNYTLYFNNCTFDGQLPSHYSLIEEGFVTPIKDQQSGGNCWAFSSIAALESAILKASGDALDLSEENMKNLMQVYSDYGWIGIETNDGGYDEMAIAYFASWLGPVNESIDEYDDYSMLSPVLNSITHVQNVLYLGRDSYTDNDAIKEAIIKYGAVSTGIYYDSTYFYYSRNSYYYYGSGYANHAVAIVGWDDSFSRNNFYYKPAGDGAWIVKNSWASDWGDNGYFYVSYYDTRLAQVGLPDASYVFVLNDTEKYDKNYQYDFAGKTDYFVVNQTTVWVENRFNSTDNELLAAVSTYFRKLTDYELFVYVNNEFVLSKNGTSTLGYQTIDLGEHISISKGDEFRVMFKLSHENEVEFAVSEKIRCDKFASRQGCSFVSFDGENWTDLYDFEYTTESDGGHTYSTEVACIKAFTILYELQPTIQLSFTNLYNKADIIAVVHDQYSNLIHSGEVVFTVEGMDYTVKIENAVANLTHVFENVGEYNISASYKNSKENISLNIDKLNIYLDLSIVKDKNNVVISFESPFKLNSTLNIKLNEDNYTINLLNGKYDLNINDLDFGYYVVNANVLDDIYAGAANSNFNITISKTRFIADDFVSYYNAESEYSIVLQDIYGNPVVNRPVSFILAGKSYAANTNSQGVASVLIKLEDKTNYKMQVLFYGDGSYFPTNATPNLEVKSTISFLTPNTYLTTSKFSISITNQKGVALARSQVNVIIDGVNYWLITDYDGIVTNSLNLKTGSHTIVVNNLATGESVSKSITVVSRLMVNKNINMYFGAGSVYKVRAYGDNGKAVGAGQIVKIAVNGKSYSVKTDKYGYASFKINLNPKTYTITATYKGYKVSNKVVVKPVLTAKDISKRKVKVVKFQAKLVNSNGKALKGKIVTFKIKGKIYKVKTNAKGFAILSLKNLNVGNYKIISKYGKSSVTNTIKIRK